MRKILVATHGYYANGIKSSLEILTGIHDNITTINAYVSDDNVDEKLKEFFETISIEDEVVIFTDLYGGSVNQKVTGFSKDKNVFIVAGFNLSMVIETFLYTGNLTKDKINELIAANRNEMKLVEIKANDEDEKNDFFC
ncbi:PTS system fructose subfamily IIA component [Clostridium sp. DL-VIII]|uniref:PTS sugar transporter subunit IIA n=1 Tax=Clostridium sp. DL-VIII TaxID=641107 RepID=UPI00023B0898|nr:PTS fructose transporter subunit IIA [Clostridium sp. DL-VIII]EHJ01696.1 PTS system fructose subfamily IIA component [Clostridium sp. DL-VIII]